MCYFYVTIQSIGQFGCSKLEERHKAKIQELTGEPPHHLLRRGVFFSHR